jgi:hypothetical protein
LKWIITFWLLASASAQGAPPCYLTVLDQDELMARLAPKEHWTSLAREVADLGTHLGMPFEEALLRARHLQMATASYGDPHRLADIMGRHIKAVHLVDNLLRPAILPALAEDSNHAEWLAHVQSVFRMVSPGEASEKQQVADTKAYIEQVEDFSWRHLQFLGVNQVGKVVTKTKDYSFPVTYQGKPATVKVRLFGLPSGIYHRVDASASLIQEGNEFTMAKAPVAVPESVIKSMALKSFEDSLAVGQTVLFAASPDDWTPFNPDYNGLALYEITNLQGRAVTIRQIAHPEIIYAMPVSHLFDISGYFTREHFEPFAEFVRLGGRGRIRSVNEGYSHHFQHPSMVALEITQFPLRYIPRDSRFAFLNDPRTLAILENTRREGHPIRFVESPHAIAHVATYLSDRDRLGVKPALTITSKFRYDIAIHERDHLRRWAKGDDVKLVDGLTSMLTEGQIQRYDRLQDAQLRRNVHDIYIFVLEQSAYTAEIHQVRADILEGEGEGRRTVAELRKELVIAQSIFDKSYRAPARLALHRIWQYFSTKYKTDPSLAPLAMEHFVRYIEAQLAPGTDYALDYERPYIR